MSGTQKYVYSNSSYSGAKTSHQHVMKNPNSGNQYITKSSNSGNHQVSQARAVCPVGPLGSGPFSQYPNSNNM